MINVHLLHVRRSEVAEMLRSGLDAGVHLTAGDDLPSDTHVLITGRPTREQLDHCPDLRALLIPFAGLPAQTRDLMQSYPQISVHNLHYNTPMTAEMALALLMATSKYLIPADREFRKHDWSVRYHNPFFTILDGKTALILGYGSIGQRVGDFCRALNMEVIGVRRRAANRDGVYMPDRLPELLPRANALIVCLPGTPQTEGMIGERELNLMPRGALVVNIGRAAVIDQAALYQALKSGHLGGAGLDVWYNYPTDAESQRHTPPADYPFHQLDNVVMSPHRAGGGGTEETEARRMATLAQGLNQMARGGDLPHRVDLEAGY